MPVIQNEQIRIELDSRWPRIISLSRINATAALDGCASDLPLRVEINSVKVPQTNITVQAEFAPTSARYVVHVSEPDLTFTCSFRLENEQVVYTIDEIQEGDGCHLLSLYLPDQRFITGRAQNGDHYLRGTNGGRRNWSRSWCPGTGAGGYEDMGPVSGGIADFSPQSTGCACVWNTDQCAVIVSSQHVSALVSELSAEGASLAGRAGRISIWSAPYVYRLGPHIAEPLEIRIAVLGDYNRNGVIDWCDAAAWQGDQGGRTPYPYSETILYKLYLDDLRQEKPLLTFAQVLEVIKRVHRVSGGVKQVVYLVGWQYQGHDTGYPSFAVVNERIGGREALVQLIENARAFNCIVSLHTNLDDSYEGNPEFRTDLVARDPDGTSHVWFTNHECNDRKVFGINHTLSYDTGYERDRLDRLLALLPLKETIHCDAHRACSEVWLADGTWYGQECEAQYGMRKVFELYAEHGLDITTEGIGGGHFKGHCWGWHGGNGMSRFGTVVDHGRVGAAHRSGPEGEGLGKWHVVEERNPGSSADIAKNFYCNWMYAQILFRKKMLRYEIGDWNEGVDAWYEDDTWVNTARGGATPRQLIAVYEGIEIARGQDRFLPWRENTIYAYSPAGGAQSWQVPQSWKGATITAAALLDGADSPGPSFAIDGTLLSFTLEPGVPVRFTIQE